jgi:tyrosyl-tRNA synthetase
LVHLQRCGHNPIALVGGATGMIGDPSGKSNERNLLGPEELARNVAGIRAQLERFLDFDAKTNPATMVNNLDWMGDMTFIDFVRDVGKHFSVAAMMNKESVKRRISQEGISFTEFSYMVLQGYDYYHLYRHYGCRLQMGGSDQWGNITAGVDLVRRHGGKAHALVYPLMTTAAGTKFGKTEAGAVWLDPARTSPYRFYQFWINAEDERVIQYLKTFTILTRGEIEELALLHAQAPHRREAQKCLAVEVTRMVHGETALAAAQRATQALFGGDLAGMSATEIEDIFEDIPSSEIPKSDFEGEGFPILALFTHCGVTKSNGEARNLLKGGGINLNNVRVSDVGRKVTLEDAIEGRFIVLRKGSKKYHLVKIA